MKASTCGRPAAWGAGARGALPSAGAPMFGRRGKRGAERLWTGRRWMNTTDALTAGKGRLRAMRHQRKHSRKGQEPRGCITGRAPSPLTAGGRRRAPGNRESPCLSLDPDTDRTALGWGRQRTAN